LHPIEVRVLGSLLEKEITTPRVLPASLNASSNACNQEIEPGAGGQFRPETVEHALLTLRDKGLLLRLPALAAGAEVRARISEKLNLGRRELPLFAN